MTTENKKQLVSKEKLLETGIHYGERSRNRNPKMMPFIHMEKDGTSIIDLPKTMASLERAFMQLSKLASRPGAKFLFVGTDWQSSEAVKLAAERTGNFYINHRWLGGLLTNQRTIQNSVNRLRTLERLEKTNFEGYTKKEGIQMKRELDKLEKALGGVKYMRRLPQAIIVASAAHEKIALAEAKLLKIPTIGIVDTDADPASVKAPIFANDDSNKAVALVITLLADAIAIANKEQPKAAYKGDDLVIEGIVERERKPRPQRRSFDNRAPRRDRRAPESRDNKEVKSEEKQDLSKLKVAELKELATKKGIEFKNSIKKGELITLIESK